MEVLLAGSLGALAVFVLGVLREWWRDERERRGLLRLLRSEIEHNAVVVSTIAERRGDRVMDWIGHPDLPSMKVETWRDVRERAAAVLPAEIMAALEGYYSPLETSLTLLRFQDAVSDTADRELTAGCIDTDLPAVRRSLGRSDRSHRESANVHHAMRVMSTETSCRGYIQQAKPG